MILLSRLSLSPSLLSFSLSLSFSFAFFYLRLSAHPGVSSRKHIAQVENISQNDTLYGTTTLLRTACSSQKKPEEFPFIVGVEMLGESRALLRVREADSSAAASPAWRYAKEFPLHFSTMYQPLRTTTLSCFSLFIYLTRHITTIPLCRPCELSLALRPLREEKTWK